MTRPASDGGSPYSDARRRAADGEWALTTILPRETGRSAARSIHDLPRDEVERVVPGIGWQTVR